MTRQVASINDPSAAFAVQVLDLRTGKPLGTVLVDTGKESFRILNVQAAGSQVVVSDNLHRVLVYSLTGKAEERLFGRRPSISPSGTLLSLENETGALLVYELGSMRQLAEFRFPSAVAFSRFTADDNTLFVLTADQTAYALRLPPTPLQATATDH